MRRPRAAPRTIAVATAALALSLPPALSLASARAGAEPDLTATRVLAVRIEVPGAQATSVGPGGSGAYAYRDLVSIGSYTATSSETARDAQASVDLSGVSLLAGLVTIAHVSSVATATSAGSAAPSGTFGGSVDGLTVAGAPVATGPNVRFDLPDGLGYGVADEQVVLSEPGSDAYRGASLGLRLHLAVGWHDMPAGTEVQLGYADAGAEAPPPPEPPPPPKPPLSAQPATPPPATTTAPPATTTTPSTPGGQPGSGTTPSEPPKGHSAPPARHAKPARPAAGPKPVPAPVEIHGPTHHQPVAKPPAIPPVTTTTPAATTAAPPPAVPAFPLEPSSTAGLPGDTEAPPPGGFTDNPPIDPAVRAQLLGGGYVFPVAGGASFTNDFGAPRADTGFHQGIDLFAPLGTPVVAIHDGTLLAVGWNQLGGHRLWLRDTAGNLFYYAHLSAYAPAAQDGAKVHAGEILGFVGNSGDAQGTPYHLHFEMHPGGGWAVPPYEYVSAWEGATVPNTTPLLGGSAAASGIVPTATEGRATGTLAAHAQPSQPTPPQAPLVALGFSDISSASGLDPAAVVAAASPSAGALSEGDGALFGGVPAPSGAEVLQSAAPVGGAPAPAARHG